MPNVFLDKEQKFDYHNFSIFCWKESKMTVLFRIMDSYFINQSISFMNTTVADIITPYRAIYE